MANFHVMMPREVMSQFEGIRRKSEDMIRAMCYAGAQTVLDRIRGSAPIQGMGNAATLTRYYKTRSDGGWNVKVYFRGHAPFSGNRTTFLRRGRATNAEVYESTKGVPYGFLAVMFEYGRSTSPFPKRPFFRRAFNNAAITAAMEKAQNQFIADFGDPR